MENCNELDYFQDSVLKLLIPSSPTVLKLSHHAICKSLLEYSNHEDFFPFKICKW